MGRMHLFEFEDQKWFPTFLRNYGTDFLQFLSNKTKMYKPIIPIIEKGLRKSKTNRIIDLGSGGGGGLIWLNSELTTPFIKPFKIERIIFIYLIPIVPVFVLWDVII